MRIRPTVLALGIALVTLGAQAQTAPQPARPAQEGPFSVFVYEKLGATPSLQRPRWTRAAPETQPRAGGAAEAPAAVQVSESPAPPARRVE